MKINRFFLVIGIVLGMAFTSCSEDFTEGENSRNPKGLKIEVADANLSRSTTRAAYSGYTTTFESGDKIGLYVVKGSSVVNANVLYTYDGTNWSTDDDIEYNDGYSYFAYYPYVASPYTPDFSQSTVDSKFSTFITDTSNKFHNADQSTKEKYTASDLMIAQGSSGGSNTVTFSMYHKKGLAVFNGDGAADATFTGNIPYLMSSVKYFLMKPSTSTSFTDDEGTYSLTASSGKYVTHNIAESYTNYILNVTGPSAFTYTGGTNSYSIQSYKQNSTGTKSKAAAWTVTYSEDGGSSYSSTKPSWLTTFTESGDGSTTTTNYSATVAAQSSSTTSETANAILKAASEVADYDLSTNGGTTTRSTANCYLVHAPGTYRLPMVYGNAIKGGVVNTSAFYTTQTSNTLQRLVNHANTGITGPWITKSGSGVDAGMGISVTSVELLWQSAAGLISSVALDGDYITFTVPAASIAEGNALIAAKAGSTIVWSWHIWLTPETLTNTTTVATGSHNYKVTPVNLGWVGSGSITKTDYAGRSCIVKVTQTGGQEETFTVTQTENVTVTKSNAGTCLYYQWGRKDPFIPTTSITGSSTTDATVYNISGSSTTGITKTNSRVNIYTAITTPTTFYYRSSSPYTWSTETSYNLWDMNNTSTDNVTTATVKTIYDPCPPGYCLPTGNLYYFMGNNGGSMTMWDSTNKGATWSNSVVANSITGDDLYFPASGCRSSSSGALGNVGSDGCYWSASPLSTTYGRNLGFNSSYWGWDGNGRAIGFPVRAVVQE